MRRPPTTSLHRLMAEADIQHYQVGRRFMRLSAAAVLGNMLWGEALRASGTLFDYVDPRRIGPLIQLELGILLGWGLLFLAARFHERHLGNPRAIIHVVVQYFALSFVSLGYTIGTLSLPCGVFMVGAPMLGFVLIERHYVLWGMASAYTAMIALTLASAAGAIPYAPMLVDSPSLTPSLTGAVSEWIYSLPFGFAALYLSATVLGRWREREREILRLSITDPLTGTFNRGYGLERLREALTHAGRAGRPVSVVMVDLDHFKHINDAHGHLTGDAALQHAATVLRDSVRDSDFVCRYGGEEFLLVLPGADVGDARDVAERCRVALAARDLHSTTGEPVSLTASLGVAPYYPGVSADDEDALLHAADEALYAAKAGGRDRVVLAGYPARALA